MFSFDVSHNYQGNGIGTDPGTASAATQAQIANMAARPFLHED